MSNKQPDFQQDRLQIPCPHNVNDDFTPFGIDDQIRKYHIDFTLNVDQVCVV
jgi:hypothetical protein